MRKSRRLKAKPWTRRYVEPVIVTDEDTGEDRADFRDRSVPGAQIRDLDTGLVYRVTIDERRGGAAVTFFSVETAAPDQQVTPDNLLPLGELIRRAREVREIADSDEPGVFRTSVPLAGSKPPLRQIAADYQEHNRAALATAYSVSRSTLDRWIRECRETVNPETGEPYLGKARTGRPRKK